MNASNQSGRVRKPLWKKTISASSADSLLSKDSGVADIGPTIDEDIDIDLDMVVKQEPDVVFECSSVSNDDSQEHAEENFGEENANEDNVDEENANEDNADEENPNEDNVGEENTNEAESTSTNVIESTTKLTDLNEKSLIEILKWLDFPDLLNAANATKALNEAANKIYGQVYVDKVVQFNGDVMSAKGLEIDVTADAIEINDSRTCLKMFCAFGGTIAKLKLNFKEIGLRRCAAITRFLIEYCSKTLIDLEWLFCPENALEQCGKQFAKLESLQLKFGHVGAHMSQFKRRFPVLRHLEMIDVQVTDRKCIETTLSNLEHLKVGIEKTKGQDFLKSNIKAALRVNPQLRSFSINAGCDLKFLEFINEMLPRLEKLEIRNPRNKFFDSNAEKVHFDRVKSLTLDIAESKDSFTSIPFEFRRLKKFKLNACFRFRDEWIDFVVQNPSLIELQLLNFHWFYVFNEQQLMKIAQLPRLTRFILEWRVSSSQAIGRFIEACQSLKKFRLSMRTRPERAAIFAELDGGWLVEIDDNFITFDRVDGEFEADVEINP